MDTVGFKKRQRYGCRGEGGEKFGGREGAERRGGGVFCEKRRRRRRHARAGPLSLEVFLRCREGRERVEIRRVVVGG
jgi:hypothetical protein